MEEKKEEEENEEEEREEENAMEGEEENEEEEGEWRGRRTSSYCAACEPGYAGIHFPCFTGTVLAYWYNSTNTDI